VNPFTTEHPLNARDSCSAKEHPFVSYLSRVLVVALVVCPALLVVLWFAAIGADSPDVPEFSWTDYVSEGLCFFTFFPIFFLIPPGSLIIDLSHAREAQLGALFNGLFW